MRILFLSISTPRKDGKGYEILLYERIKFLLTLGVKVDLFVSAISESYLDDLVDLQKLSENFNYKIHKLNKLEIIKNVFFTLIKSKLPCQVGIYANRNLTRVLNKFIHENKIDFIISNLIRPIECVPENSRDGIVVDALDSMTLNFQRRLQEAKTIKKMMLWFEYKRLRNFEQNFRESQKIVTVAKLDLDYISGGQKYCIELGVSETDKITKANCEYDRYVFSGNMHYGPNIDAFDFLNIEIWPAIIKINPNAELHVVGRGSEMLETNYESVKLIGSVTNMSEYLASMDVAIAPMRLGSGMQFKILEALSVGLPVITTTLGLGSIGAEVGKDVFLFYKLDELENEIEKIKTVGDRRQQRREFIKKYHSWDNSNDRFITLLTETRNLH